MTTVVLTRSRPDNLELAQTLRGMGANVLELPCNRVEHIADTAPLAAAIRALGSEDRLVFTSRIGVEVASRAVSAVDLRVPVAAIGRATAAECARWGVEAWIPSEATGFRLGRELPLGSGVVVLARAEHADEALPRELLARGARVEELTTYRTVPEVRGDIDAVRRAVALGATVVLASPSATTTFVQAIGREALAHAPIVVVGPTTARRVVELLGREPRIIAMLDAANVLALEVSHVADR